MYNFSKFFSVEKFRFFWETEMKNLDNNNEKKNTNDKIELSFWHYSLFFWTAWQKNSDEDKKYQNVKGIFKIEVLLNFLLHMVIDMSFWIQMQLTVCCNVIFQNNSLCYFLHTFPLQYKIKFKKQILYECFT